MSIGLLNGDYGYSTAVGLFNSVANVILLIFVNWVVKKLNDGEEMGKKRRAIPIIYVVLASYIFSKNRF